MSEKNDAAHTENYLPSVPDNQAPVEHTSTSSNQINAQLGTAIVEWLKNNPAAVEQIGNAIKVVGEFAQKICTVAVAVVGVALEASASIGQMLVKVHESYAARIEQYPQFLTLIPLLAQRGWFVSGSFALSQIDELAMSARESSIEQVENKIFALYDENIEWLGEVLVHSVPSKAFLIQPAIAAHQRGEFAVSIPLFFILSDGVCFETVQRYVFQARKDEEKLSVLACSQLEATGSQDAGNVIFEFYNALWKAMWASQSEKLPLAYGEKERKSNNYLGLNRHTIMHGISNEEYATKENSLKAFSLLSHLAALTHHQPYISN
ncbi:hypothetical protein [uncultured Oxalicibacterium sp.]|uniref:hypothetical protein n=1 Tax=uncultured Oxalicibacterium sp. TaxID=1168540 RepID=UPI0025CD784A|nr:hypothetical protein [uncultured Oxalicibacterium sp.]